MVWFRQQKEEQKRGKRKQWGRDHYYIYSLYLSSFQDYFSILVPLFLRFILYLSSLFLLSKGKA